MNKDLYISLLEEHVDDLKTISKIDAVLSNQKSKTLKVMQDIYDVDVMNAKGRIKELEDALSEIKIKHDKETVNLRDDFQKTLETIKEQNTRECGLNVRLQGKIANLEEDLGTANRRIKDLQDALGATPL